MCNFQRNFLFFFKTIIYNKANEKWFLIEAGCGVGNAIFPIAKLNLPNLYTFGFDLSKTAIELS